MWDEDLTYAMKRYDEADEETRREMYRQELISSQHWTKAIVTQIGEMCSRRRADRTTGGDHITMRNIRANGPVIGKYEAPEKEVEQ